MNSSLLLVSIAVAHCQTVLDDRSLATLNRLTSEYAENNFGGQPGILDTVDLGSERAAELLFGKIFWVRESDQTDSAGILHVYSLLARLVGPFAFSNHSGMLVNDILNYLVLRASDPARQNWIVKTRVSQDEQELQAAVGGIQLAPPILAPLMSLLFDILLVYKLDLQAKQLVKARQVHGLFMEMIEKGKIDERVSDLAPML